MGAPIVIEFKNLVESCGSLNDGNVVSVKTAEHPRAFSASNARCEAVMRTQTQISNHAKSIAKLMCNG